MKGMKIFSLKIIYNDEKFVLFKNVPPKTDYLVKLLSIKQKPSKPFIIISNRVVEFSGKKPTKHSIIRRALYI